MNWLDVSKQVAAAGAGLLSSTLAGPAVGSKVGALVASALGVAHTPEAVSQALVDSPEALLKLKEIEAVHEATLQNLALQELQAQLADVQSARVQQGIVQASEAVPWYAKAIQPGLAAVGVFAAFALFALFVSGGAEISTAQKEIAIYILGILSAILGQIYSYYFGSSSGSAKKTDLLKNR